MQPMLRLFGTPALVLNGAPIRLAAAPKALALLGLIAARGDLPCERARLAALLYPDRTDSDARTAARRHLYDLTKLLPPGAFSLTKNTVRLELPSDIATFLDDAACRADPIASLALRTGGDYCASVIDDALEPIREAIETRYRTILKELASAHRERGSTTDAIRALEQLVAADPLNEDPVRDLMRLHGARGDRSSAIVAYNALVQRLRAEIDVEPERETTALFQELLFGSQSAGAPHNLPTFATSFVGREREMRIAGEALCAHRIVTITGGPGIGKTRLATRLAIEHLADFPDGVWCATLASVNLPAQVLDYLHSVLQISGSQAASETAIGQALRAKRALIVLDNCEHVLEAARSLATSIAATTDARVLVTSRKRLGIDGEFVIPLETLAVPPAAELRTSEIKRSEAARLFFERAVAVSPSFRLTEENASTAARIVRRLDGLPLALELVAARANLLTLDGMLKRLVDGSPSSGVEKAIAWSWDLLSPKEALLLAELTVFSGGWTLEAAERIVSTSIGDVFATMSELVESSLITVQRNGEEVRYAMYEATKHFASARLPADNREPLMARHAAYYCTVAETFAPAFRADTEIEAYARCDAEYPNILAAMEWARDRDPDLCARFAGALWRYGIFRWRLSDLDPLIILALTAAERLEPHRLANVHLAAGMFAKERMQHDRAVDHLGRAREIFEATGNRTGEADALNARAIVTFNHADPSLARERFLEVATLQEQLGDLKALAGTTANLAAVAQMLGDEAEALAYLERALAGFLATRHDRGVAYTYRAMAHSLELTGRIDDAIDAARRSVALYEQLQDRSRMADGLITLAHVLVAAGSLPEAFRTFARAFDTLAGIDHPLFVAQGLLGYAITAHHAGDDLESVRAAAAAFAIADDAAFTISERYRREIAETLDAARGSLGTLRYDAAWAAGRHTPMESFARNAREAGTRL